MVVRQSIDVGYFRCVDFGDCFADGILPVGSSCGKLFSGEETYDGGLSLIVLVSGGIDYDEENEKITGLF